VAAPAAVVSVVSPLAGVPPAAVAVFVVVPPAVRRVVAAFAVRVATAAVVEHHAACSFVAVAAGLVEPVSADSVAAVYRRSVRAVEPPATFEPVLRDFEPREDCLDCVVVNDAVPAMLAGHHWLPGLKGRQYEPDAVGQLCSAASAVESAVDSSVVQSPDHCC